MIFRLHCSFGLVLSLMLAHSAAVAADWRNYLNGSIILTNGYADQPFTVALPDDSILAVVTTGPTEEGQDGQHVVASRSADGGATWSAPVSIEPTGSIFSSWALPYLSHSGRVYAIYLWGDPPETNFPAADRETHGYFAYRYSDDEGRTWSSNRTLIPLPNATIDDENIYNGACQLLWSVDKPVEQNSNVLFAFTKLRASLNADASAQYEEGFVLSGAGMSAGADPDSIHWTVLPNAAGGFRVPGFGGVQEEHNLARMNNGGLYLVFRTADGLGGHAVSFDGGQTWPIGGVIPVGFDQSPLKQPRANLRIFKLDKGRYLLWNHFNGTRSFSCRNPAWVCPGFETTSNIVWGAPEILLYATNPAVRISYPDLYQWHDNWFVTETDKQTARVHRIAPSFLEEIFTPVLTRGFDSQGLIFTSDKMRVAPPLGNLAAPTNQGFTIETTLTVTNLTPGQMLLKNLDHAGRGFSIATAVNGALQFHLSDGTHAFNWTTDERTVRPGISDHVTFEVDSQAKIFSVTADGRVQNGGSWRPFGWGFLPLDLGNVNSRAPLWYNDVALKSTPLLRIYNRPLLHCEAIGNYFALGWTPARAVITHESLNVITGQICILSAFSSDVSRLASPVFKWRTDEGVAGAGETFSTRFSTPGFHTVWLSIQDANHPLPANGAAKDAVVFNVMSPQHRSAAVLSTNVAVAGRWSCDFTTRSIGGDPSAVWVGRQDYSRASIEGSGCAVFDGRSYLLLGNYGRMEQFTLAAYVNPAASIAAEGFKGLVGGTVWEAGAIRLSFQSGHLALIINLGGNRRAIINSPPILPDQWTHVAVTANRNRNQVAMYINGVLVGVAKLDGLNRNFSLDHMACGWEQDDRYFTGSVDDILIAKTALTASEIAKLAAFTMPKNEKRENIF